MLRPHTPPSSCTQGAHSMGKHFRDNPAAAAEAGRKAMAIRWGRATQADKDAAVAHMNAAKRAGYLAKAESDLTRLGLDPTPEMVEHSATMLFKADLAERARAGRERNNVRRTEDKAWVQRVHRVVLTFIDGVVGELGLTLQPGMPAIVAKVAHMAMADETDLPQSERNFQRLSHRLEEYRQFLHLEACPFTRWPDADPCLHCGSTFGVRGDSVAA